MLYYIIRHIKETQEKNDALREIRRNGWRSTYFVKPRRRWWR